MRKYLQPYPISLALLVIVYLVGIVTSLVGEVDELMTLTPYNLLFANLLILWNAKAINPAYVLWFGVCAISGYLLEVIGVHTGLIFGEYEYGANLGIKVAGVPLLIGLNWSILVFATAALVNKPWIKHSLRPVLAATLMVLYDLLLEPVAIRHDFWSWSGGNIPLKNYITWWIVSYLMLLGAFRWVRVHENKIAPWVLGIQALFFAILLTLVH